MREKVRGSIVGCARPDGRWLLIRRSAEVWSPRLVCFPGGTAEEGEDPRATALREMQEELAADVELLDCVWHTRFTTDVDVELWGWLGRLRSERLVPDPGEVEAVLWMTRDEIRRRTDAVQPSTGLFIEALERATA